MNKIQGEFKRFLVDQFHTKLEVDLKRYSKQLAENVEKSENQKTINLYHTLIERTRAYLQILESHEGKTFFEDFIGQIIKQIEEREPTGA